MARELGRRGRRADHRVDGFFDRLDRQPPHMYVIGWTADYPDPHNFLGASGISRYTGWRNAAFDRLIEEARSIPDQARRMQLYRQADRILMEEAAIVPLTYLRAHLLVKPWVRQYPMAANGWCLWKDAIIEAI